MPNTEQAPPENTRRDPHNILLELERIVDERQPPKGQHRSWVAALIIALVAMVGAGIWLWISTKRNRELARLRHQKNEQSILAKKAAADAKVMQLEEQAKEHQRVFEEASQRLRILEADYRSEVALYEADRKAIDRIRSWRDVTTWRELGER